MVFGCRNLSQFPKRSLQRQPYVTVKNPKNNFVALTLGSHSFFSLFYLPFVFVSLLIPVLGTKIIQMQRSIMALALRCEGTKKRRNVSGAAANNGTAFRHICQSYDALQRNGLQGRYILRDKQGRGRPFGTRSCAHGDQQKQNSTGQHL